MNNKFNKGIEIIKRYIKNSNLNYYELFSINENESIKKQMREILITLHPDNIKKYKELIGVSIDNFDSIYNELVKVVVDAESILTDESKKKEYDESLNKEKEDINIDELSIETFEERQEDLDKVFEEIFRRNKSIKEIIDIIVCLFDNNSNFENINDKNIRFALNETFKELISKVEARQVIRKTKAYGIRIEKEQVTPIEYAYNYIAHLFYKKDNEISKYLDEYFDLILNNVALSTSKKTCDAMKEYYKNDKTYKFNIEIDREKIKEFDKDDFYKVCPRLYMMIATKKPRSVKENWDDNVVRKFVQDLSKTYNDEIQEIHEKEENRYKRVS